MRFLSKVHVPPSPIGSAACLGGPVPGCDSQSKELGYSSWSSVEARTRWINAELQFTEYSRGLGFVEMVVYLTASLRSAPSLVVIRLLVHVASPSACASTHPSTHQHIYSAIHMSLFRAEYGLYTLYGRSNRLAIRTTNYSSFFCFYKPVVGGKVRVLCCPGY